ncbi:MAG: hypothetical protein WCR19_02920, partial [Acholeplasmataceae bacterium]
NDLKLKMQRDTFEFEHHYLKFREDNLNTVDEIENEFKLTEEKLNQKYNSQKENLELQKMDIDQVKTDSNKNKDDDQSLITSNNNDLYIGIKQTFNDASIAINQKISVLNKSYQQALKKIDTLLSKLNQPIATDILHLKDTYQLKIDELKAEYVNHLQNFDLDFEAYTNLNKQKREKISHEHAEAISIFNSKLTNNRDSFEKEKNKIVYEHRSQMKDLDESQQLRVASAMKRKLNALDHDFNKLIIQTRKDITKMKRDYQQRMTEEENKFLHERFEWRVNKLYLTNQFHQNLKKLEINYKYNLEFASQKHQLNNDQSLVKKDILSDTLSQDALPLETQLAIQTLVQERELNLLNNDQEIAMNELKIELLNIELTYDTAFQEITYLEQINELDLESEILVLNSNKQLELEKSKIKREESLKDYHLRKTLAESSFKLQKNTLDHEFEQHNIQWTADEDMEEVWILEQQFLAEHEETLMYQKRSYFMRDADLTTKSRMQQNEIIKNIRKYQSDIEFEQKNGNSYINTLIFVYDRLIQVKKMINDLYHLPAHPEVFKNVLKLFKEYIESLDQMILDSLDLKQNQLLTYLEEQKLNKDQHKQTLKHETYQFFYQNNIDQFDTDIHKFEAEIKVFENSILSEQAIVEKNKAFINQLKKIIKTFKDGSYNSEQNEVKENLQLIKRHEYNMQAAYYRIRVFEKEISRNHKMINRLSFKKQHLMRAIKKENIHYKRCLHKDQKIYDLFIKKFNTLYKQFKIQLSIKNFSTTLFDHIIFQNSYITESQMKHVITDFDKLLLNYSNSIMINQQKQLRFISQYYHMHLDKEALMIQAIKAHEHRASHILKHSEKLFKKTINRIMKEQQNLNKHALITIKYHQTIDLSSSQIQTKKAEQQLKIVIKNHEDQISKLSKFVDQQIKTINQNQHEIALQYENDTNEKRHSFYEQHQKKLKLISFQHQKHIDDFQHSVSQVIKKNQLLLEKFKEHEKQTLNTHQQRLLQLKHKKEDSLQKINNLENQYLVNQKNSLKSRNATFKQLSLELKAQNSQMLKKENKGLKLELNEEKASYHFKIKSLNLD